VIRFPALLSTGMHGTEQRVEKRRVFRRSAPPGSISLAQDQCAAIQPGCRLLGYRGAVRPGHRGREISPEGRFPGSPGHPSSRSGYPAGRLITRSTAGAASSSSPSGRPPAFAGAATSGCAGTKPPTCVGGLHSGSTSGQPSGSDRFRVLRLDWLQTSDLRRLFRASNRLMASHQACA